jgi:protein required for attachment to host cells
MRPTDTWVCVADGARAQFYRCDGPGRDLEPLLGYGLASSSRAHGRAMTVDRPGRTFDSAGFGRHAYDEGDWQEDQKRRFAGCVADHLDRAADQHLFEHLVLVAPPGILGDLRKMLKGHTRDLVVAEVDKDLTHATPREVTCHLGGVLPH